MVNMESKAPPKTPAKGLEKLAEKLTSKKKKDFLNYATESDPDKLAEIIHRFLEKDKL